MNYIHERNCQCPKCTEPKLSAEHKPKTAVQWLLQRIPLSVRAELIELGHEDEALAMEREQIVKAADTQTEKSETTGQQYYTETYGE